MPLFQTYGAVRAFYYSGFFVLQKELHPRLRPFIFLSADRTSFPHALNEKPRSIATSGSRIICYWPRLQGTLRAIIC